MSLAASMAAQGATAIDAARRAAEKLGPEVARGGWSLYGLPGRLDGEDEPARPKK